MATLQSRLKVLEAKRPVHINLAEQDDAIKLSEYAGLEGWDLPLVQGDSYREKMDRVLTFFFRRGPLNPEEGRAIYRMIEHFKKKSNPDYSYSPDLYPNNLGIDER